MKQTILIALMMTACSAQCVVDNGNGCTDFAMACPKIEGGFGKISARSKGQSKNAAKAQNEYDDEEERLQYQGKTNEVLSGQKSDTGFIVQKQFICINGVYDAEENICSTNAAKVGESGRSASCFRREAGQHLNEIAGQCLPEPLQGKQLCDCDCSKSALDC